MLSSAAIDVDADFFLSTKPSSYGDFSKSRRYEKSMSAPQLLRSSALADPCANFYLAPARIFLNIFSSSENRLADYIPSTARDYDVPSSSLESWNPIGMGVPSFKSLPEVQESWISKNLRASTFYQTDLISENSAVMAKTQNEFVNSPILEQIQEEAQNDVQAVGK